MKELKGSAYKDVKTGVIASRDQLCINPKLKGKTNSDKIHMCRGLRKKDKCEFYRQVGEGLKDPEITTNAILDIEDLGRIGKRLNCCPFYMSRDIVHKAEIVFMPYNYLLHPQIREASKINLKNAIVILDEGHNVETFCEESASSVLKSTQIEAAIENANYVC